MNNLMFSLLPLAYLNLFQPKIEIIWLLSNTGKCWEIGIPNMQKRSRNVVEVQCNEKIVQSISQTLIGLDFYYQPAIPKHCYLFILKAGATFRYFHDTLYMRLKMKFSLLPDQPLHALI